MMKTQDITILGAGIAGLMNAYTLSSAGHNITIYDPKGFPADNASHMAGGMLAPWSEIEHMDLGWVRAGLKGIEIWRDMDLDTGFTQNGSLLIAYPEDRYILERFKSHLPTEKQTAINPQSYEPALDKKFASGIALEDEAHLAPHKTMNAICNFLEDKVKFIAEKAPKGLNADWIIDCRGMAANDPNIRGVKGETLLVRNTEFSLSRPVRLMHPRYPLYIIPREDHVFMIGATVIESAENENVSLRSSMELMSALYALSPSFGEAEIIEIKAGIRPSYTDNLPRITINENMIGCNGLFRHGYLLASVMAACVADHLSETENEFMHLFKDETHESDNQRRREELRSAA